MQRLEALSNQEPCLCRSILQRQRIKCQLLGSQRYEPNVKTQCVWKGQQLQLLYSRWENLFTSTLGAKSRQCLMALLTQSRLRIGSRSFKGSSYTKVLRTMNELLMVRTSQNWKLYTGRNTWSQLRTNIEQVWNFLQRASRRSTWKRLNSLLRYRSSCTLCRAR